MEIGAQLIIKNKNKKNSRARQQKRESSALTPDSQRLSSDRHGAKAISETTPFKQLKTTMLSVIDTGKHSVPTCPNFLINQLIR